MKKSLRIVLCCTSILIALFLGFSLWWYFRTSYYASDEMRQNDLATLKSQDYNCILLSMYSVENLDPENFSYFRGIPTLKAHHTFKTLKDIGDYLECAYDSGQDITSIYMGVDPALIAGQYGHHASLYHREYEKQLTSHITAHPGTHFEFLLPYYSLEHWTHMSEAEKEETFTAYRNFINIFAGNSNVTIYFFGQEEWLIANSGNYESYNSCNPEVTSTLLAMTIRDDHYRITAENIEVRLQELNVLIEKATSGHPSQIQSSTEKHNPYSYNFSDYEFIFFGDSVIGNYTDSLSIPGVVAGNGHTSVYNLGQGGTTATMTDGTVNSSPDDPAYGEQIQSLQTIVDAFLAKTPSLLNTGSQPQTGLTEYLKAHDFAEEANLSSENPITTKEASKLCFVINYGLNDYFEGYPVTSAQIDKDGSAETSAFAIYSYQGSLRTAVEKLTAAYPDCTIFLLTPNFCSYYENGTVKQGTEGGILTDYVDAVKKLSEELSGEYPVYCIDNYHQLGIHATNHGDYLTDGCHPNEKGRFRMGMTLLECAEEVLP